MNIDLEKEQQLFEVFARTQGLQLLKWDSDNYASESTQLAWDSWLASITRQGNTLVPTTPSKEKILEMRKYHQFQQQFGFIDMTKMYKIIVGE